MGYEQIPEPYPHGCEMLRALGEQLKRLAADPENNFASAIRRLTGPRESVRFGQPLRRMILALPPMITQLRRWSDGSGLPARTIRMQKFALSYLYEPIDFVSTSDSELFRYLDDAYLFARIYQLTLSDHGRSRTKTRGGNPALARNIPEWIALARQLVPKETAQIDALLAEVARGRTRRRQRPRSRTVKPGRTGRRKRKK